jgi:methyl-accepting chemotaxis protein
MSVIFHLTRRRDLCNGVSFVMRQYGVQPATSHVRETKQVEGLFLFAVNGNRYMKIRTRLILGFVGCGVIPTLIVGLFNYYSAVTKLTTIELTAEASLSERAQTQLVALRDVRKTQIGDYCKKCLGDMDSLVHNVAAMRNTATQTLSNQHAATRRAVEEHFQQTISELNAVSASDSVKDLYQRLVDYHGAAQTGEDQPFNVSTPEYQEIAKTYGASLRTFRQSSGCSDVYLVCLKHGHVMYADAGKADAGTNLVHGPYKNEGLARLWRQISETKQPSVSDYGPYTAADGAQVLFVGCPVSNAAGEVVGMAAVQIPASEINALVQRREGLGQTGETFLVGSAEGTVGYRSDRTIQSGKIGEPASGSSVEAALAGTSGIEHSSTSTGMPTICCHDPVNVPGVKWGIVTTIELQEMIAPKVNEKNDIYQEFVENYGYYDLFLISPSGYCFYTVAHEKDYQTNFMDGPYKDSNFAQLIRKVMQEKKMAACDFSPYAPSNGDFASFAAAPILNGDKTELIVALQMPMEGINAIMGSRVGMGKTGCTYLMGINEDSGKTAFRSDLTFMDPKYVVGYEATTPYIEKAFEKPDAEGNGVFEDSHGNDVIAAYTRVDFFGQPWAILAKFNGSEALAAAEEIDTLAKSATRSMLTWTVGIGLVVAAIVLAAGYVMAMQIVRPLKRTSDMLKDIAEGEGDLTRSLDDSRKDELGELAHWFNSFVGKLRSLIGSVADNARTLTSASTQLSATATQLNSGAEETTRQASTVASASEEMSVNMNSMAAATEQMTTNVKSVAAATEEMTATVAEIARNAEQASTIANGAAELVQSSNATIAQLGTSADEIGKVIDVIQDIADQTNLLALNATIEAARAGAAGAGFAVVATEVKELARKTGDATEDIRRRIEGIQGSSSSAVQAITRISEVIEQVKDVSRTIASAVEEQSITTREIAQNVAETSRAAQTVSIGVSQSAVASSEITQTIAGVDEASKQTAQGASQTHSAGAQMLQLASELNDLVGRFKT